MNDVKKELVLFLEKLNSFVVLLFLERIELVEYLTLPTKAKKFDDVAFSEEDVARVDRVTSLHNTCQSPLIIK